MKYRAIIIRDEQILEDNTLIAKFMGFEWKRGWSPKNSPLADFHWEVPVDNPLYNRAHCNAMLNFDCAWDWLMPVWFKIYDLYSFNEYKITPTSTQIYLSEKIKIYCGQIDETNETTCGSMIVKEIMAKGGIMATWITIVEFIKWHNANK